MQSISSQSKRFAFFAFLRILVLIGLPPFGGFLAKLIVIQNFSRIELFCRILLLTRSIANVFYTRLLSSLLKTEAMSFKRQKHLLSVKRGRGIGRLGGGLGYGEIPFML